MTSDTRVFVRSTLLSLALFASAFGASGCGEEKTASVTVAEVPQGMEIDEWGEQLFQTKGCVACHSVTTVRGVGPSLRGVWGSSRTLIDGSSATADEAYVRESILTPQAKIVQGYTPQMPDYENMLSEAQLEALVRYVEKLK